MSFYDFGTWGYLSAFALIAWIPISAYVFRRMPPATAAMFLLLHAIMWLPFQAAFDFPAIPPLDKLSISSLCVLFFGYTKARKRIRAARFGTGLDLLVFMLMAGIAGTIATNREPVRAGVVFLPGLQPYDGISFALRDFIQVGVPLLAGRAFLRSVEDIQEALRVMMVAALIYTVPILYEIRMSPMLHANIYGFVSAHEWGQNVRDGGYRATVFMGHGLIVALFICMCILATVTLRVSGSLRKYRGVPVTLLIAGLCVVMVLSKTAGALLYTIFGVSMLVLTSVKTQVRVAMALSVVVMLFPLLRITGVFPVDDIVEIAQAQMGNERAESLAFRFRNEDALLAKAQDKPTFGWGGYNRERIFNPDNGDDLTVEDGMWIIMYSMFGVWGFLCYFAIFVAPIVYLWLRIDRIRGKRERALLAGVAMILLVCSIDMLPNAGMENIPLFLAGGLFVVVRDLSQRPKRPREVPQPELRPV